jgi:hypothetical protein
MLVNVLATAVVLVATASDAFLSAMYESQLFFVKKVLYSAILSAIALLTEVL